MAFITALVLKAILGSVLGLCWSTKDLVLAFHLSEHRGVKNAVTFMKKLGKATDPMCKFQLNTDGLNA